MKIIEFQRSAEMVWEGDVARGTGRVTSGTESFQVAATFPSLRGEPAGVTTPEELLAASHATCFGIGLRSVIARRGGSVSRLVVLCAATSRSAAKSLRWRSKGSAVHQYRCK